MSLQESNPITIKLLDKEFSFNCPADPEAEAQLRASAEFLNDKMLEIRSSGRVLGLERIVVMAAMNLAHELLQNKTSQSDTLNEKLRFLSNKIEFALNDMDKDSNQ